MLIHKPFYFLRHGETDWNQQHRYQGATDIPLNSVGVEQALGVREFVTNKSIAYICSSNLMRAQKTAEIVNGVLNVLHTVHAGLQEVNFGDHEGEEVPINNQACYVWYQGEKSSGFGECYTSFVKRITQAMNACLSTMEGIPLIVAHGLLFEILKTHMGHQETLFVLKNCELIFCEPPIVGDIWKLTSINY